jgi:hypothetical protein
LLVKLCIPKADDKFDEFSDIGKIATRIFKLTHIAYTELILSIDVKASYGKIPFIIIKGCKSKDYPDGNVVSAWENLKSKYKLASALLWLS